MAGSTCWGCPQHDGKHGQQCPQGRRKGSIATAATRHDVSPPSARGIERTSLVKANLVAANDLTWLYYPPCRWDKPWKTRGHREGFSLVPIAASAGPVGGEPA